MITCIDQVLTPENLHTIYKLLQNAEFVDGKLTAGTFAKQVKNNDQLKNETKTAQAIRAIIKQALQNNALLQAIARPKVIRPPILSRYSVGMAYGWHTDNAVMGKHHLNRSDISLTIFLSDPDSYQGGELIIDTGLGEHTFKLSAGSMVVYPSTFLHRVGEVIEGVRLAAVTWIQSLVRETHHREILFDIDTVRRSIFEKHGKTVEFDLLCKTHANLLRQWVEI